jgi:uncharacterized alpha-E superfamily protein
MTCIEKYGKLSPATIRNFNFDKEFPRSILACLIIAEQSLITLSGSAIGFTNPAQKQLGALKSQLEYVDIDDIISKGMHEYLDEIQGKLNNISSAIYNSFLQFKPIMQK